MRFRSRHLRLLSVAAFGSGCLTVAADDLPSLDPLPPIEPVLVEHALGHFESRLDGGSIVPARAAARVIDAAILSRWMERGYVRGHRYVGGEFSRSGDLMVTLTGAQTGRASLARQLLGLFSLGLIPASVELSIELEAVAVDPRTGGRYVAAARGRFVTHYQVLLMLVAPLSSRGADATLDHLAIHLYAQLAEQGAFGVLEGAKLPE